MPQQMPVHVMTSMICVESEGGGYCEFELFEFDATEADDVRVIGGYVLVKGR